MSRSTNLIVEAEDGETQTIAVSETHRPVSELLASHGHPLNTRCGQRGLCKGCEVELQEGEFLVDGESVSAPATVHACRAKLSGSATVHVPLRSRIEHRPQVGETFDISVPYSHDPPFPAIAGKQDCGFAVDIGTTTVVVMIVDLITGEVLARAGDFNAQIRFGDNVLTRIEIGAVPEELTAMQRAVVMETIAPLMQKACERADRSPDRIAGGTISGNTTMFHLLTGEDPSSLGVAPFTPRFIKGKLIRASDIGLEVPELNVETPIQLLPGIAAYIGSDITAGVFASGMVFDTKPSLLVDIGTNGEVVLQSAGKLTACATAAGPAFEGSGLRCGTRAREGAVSDLNIQMNPFSAGAVTIGETPPARASGICGSAYVDFLATAKSSGLLGPTGRFISDAWNDLPQKNRASEEEGRALLLNKANLRVSEVDIALLLQAKAAIGAGIEILMQTAGISADEIGTVYLAGGFGMHLNIGNAIAIGLLPGFREHQIQVVGNTALAGSLLALLDQSVMSEMEDLRQQTEIIELNLVEDFEDCYIDHLCLP